MYKIKPNGNYNLVVTDINFSINSTQTEGISISKELFDSSSEIKRLIDAKLLLVEEVKVEPKKSVSSKTDKKENNEEKVFVVQGEESKAPEGVFVKDTGTFTGNVAVKQVEAVTKDVKKVKVETPVETKTETAKVETVAKVETKAKVEAPVEKVVAKNETESKISTEDKKNVVNKKAVKKDITKK